MSGTVEVMRASIILCTVALLIAPTVSAQETSTNTCPLSQVLASRAKIQESVATFTQERRIRYVRDPLFSAGRLRFVAPNHLEMIVDKPQEESFVYEDGVLTLETAEQAERQISVNSDLILSAMFTGLVGTLSGNEDELRRTFFVDFSDDHCQWHMALLPKSKRVLEKIREIDLSGNSEHIEKAEILQANGDRSILSISEQQ
jgi:hypothetical protein